MASYNAYIRTLAIGKKTFSAKLQGIEFFSEYLETVAKMGSDFAREVKEKGNWRIAGWGKDKIDNLARPIHNQNAMHQDSNASQETAFRIIISKWGTKRADYICQIIQAKNMQKKSDKPTCIGFESKPVN